MRPRIRTLKPEIWEDEAVGRLGPWERLLYIGLITMADDEGRLRALPSAIAGHVFPYDDLPPVKIVKLLEVIAASGLVQRYTHSDVEYVQIKGWTSHQKINRVTPSSLPPPPGLEAVSYKKRAIPEATRRAVATRAGAVPGEDTPAACHYCGAGGMIHWKRLSSGRAGSWVAFAGLELDYLIPEVDGGTAEADNIVLACQKCNRHKGHRHGPEYAPVRSIDEARTG